MVACLKIMRETTLVSAREGVSLFNRSVKIFHLTLVVTQEGRQPQCLQAHLEWTQPQGQRATICDVEALPRWTHATWQQSAGGISLLALSTQLDARGSGA